MPWRESEFLYRSPLLSAVCTTSSSTSTPLLALPPLAATTTWQLHNSFSTWAWHKLRCANPFEKKSIDHITVFKTNAVT
jgi:hypothetical protein